MSNSALIERYTNCKNKTNEYYTYYSDIEKELSNYKERFIGKTVYCNCDGESSNFVKYFIDNFDNLGLKHLVSTCIEGYRLDYDGKTLIKTTIEPQTLSDLEYNAGDCFSPYCKEILKQCDIVVTNPPFSFLKHYIPMLKAFNKDFIIVISFLNLQTSYIFPSIKDKSFYIGHNNVKRFFNDNNDKLTVSCLWLTTIPTIRNKQLPKTVRFAKCRYKKVFNSNYDIYIVDSVHNIPKTNNLLLVPLNFLLYDTSDYEIIGNVRLYSNAKEYLRPIEQNELCMLGETQRKHYCPNRTTTVYYNKDGKLVSTFKSTLVRRKLG